LTHRDNVFPIGKELDHGRRCCAFLLGVFETIGEVREPCGLLRQALDRPRSGGIAVDFETQMHGSVLASERSPTLRRLGMNSRDVAASFVQGEAQRLLAAAKRASAGTVSFGHQPATTPIAPDCELAQRSVPWHPIEIGHHRNSRSIHPLNPRRIRRSFKEAICG
jgi:hypothetical protein